MTPPRRAGPDSAVSVVVPCFNHGMFLEESLWSVRAQTRPVAEVIVVDDGSTDGHTLEVLRQVEGEGLARVLRQANAGPAAARNRGVAESSGDLVLPLDADNRLAPVAVAAMVAALVAAPDDVRWAYPHQCFFGNRDDLGVMPEFNLWRLLSRNFCDTGSLVDRSVFEAGCSYRDDIGLGHEDWDFFLAAAERGFTGVPVHEKVFYVRKHGFTRSEQVEHRYGSFADEMQALHPQLFAPESLLRIKQRWAPALSLVLDGWAPALGGLLDEQSFQDFEVVGRHRRDGRYGPDAAVAAAQGAGDARGRWVLVWSGPDASPLRDRAFLEKAVSVVEHLDPAEAVALTAVDARFGWHAVPPGRAEDCLGVVFGGALLGGVVAGRPGPVSAATALTALEALPDARVRWRGIAPRAGGPILLPVATAGDQPGPGPGGAPGDPELARLSRDLERSFRHCEAAALHRGHEVVTRLPVPPRDSAAADGWAALVGTAWGDWVPEHTRPLLVTLDPSGTTWLLEVGCDDDRDGPTGVAVGRVYTQAFPGTVPLHRHVDVRTGAHDYVLGEPPDPQWSHPLGHLSTAHLPGMVGLAAAVGAGLERLGNAWGGLPPAGFTVGGEEVGAFLEGYRTRSRDRSAEPVECPGWAVYEAVDGDGRRVYSTHPDAPVAAGGGLRGRVEVVARMPAPGRTPALLVEAVHPSGSRAYVSGPPYALSGAYTVAAVMGSLLRRQLPGTVPLVRLLGVAAEVTAGPPPHHRLATSGLEALTEGGAHQPEGILGYVLAPDGGAAPLYRWRHRGRDEWRYTLASPPPEGDGGVWRFEGTVGLAFAPTAGRPDLVDLVELRHPVTGAVVYACGDQPELATHLLERVVARVHRRHDGGVVPLFRLIGPGGEVVLGVNPAEGRHAGYRAEGPVGFVGMAVPPTAAVQPARPAAGAHRLVAGEGDAAVDGMAATAPGPGLVALVAAAGGPGLSLDDGSGDGAVVGYAAAGPFPWSVPVYELVERATGRHVLTTNGEPALLGTHAVLQVVCFLGSPAGVVDAATMAGADGVPGPGPVARLTPARLGDAARVALGHLPPPAADAVRRTWRAVRPVSRQR